MFIKALSCVQGGDGVRIGFRTTIEENLIMQLKEEAFRQRRHVNDILEVLIENYLDETNKTDENVAKIDELSEEERMGFLVEKIMDSIDECAFSYRCDYRGIPRNLIRDAIYSVLSNFFVEKE